MESSTSPSSDSPSTPSEQPEDIASHGLPGMPSNWLGPAVLSSVTGSNTSSSSPFPTKPPAHVPEDLVLPGPSTPTPAATSAESMPSLDAAAMSNTNEPPPELVLPSPDEQTDEFNSISPVEVVDEVESPPTP